MRTALQAALSFARNPDPGEAREVESEELAIPCQIAFVCRKP